LIGQSELTGLEGACLAEEVFEGETIEAVLLSDELGDDLAGIRVRAVLLTSGAAERELPVGTAFESEPDDEMLCEKELAGRAIPA
jgi:hypothetical protein